MPISDEHLDDFIKRWENAFDETPQRNEATVRALELIELYKVLSTRPHIENKVIAPAAALADTNEAPGDARCTSD